MDFKIPSKFSVGGQEMQVKLVKKVENSEVLGTCCLEEGLIRIADTADGITQSDSSKVNTFFHELIHSILDTMCEKELNGNEKFVCCFAGFLTEAIKSME